MTSKLISKLINNDTGACYWHYGANIHQTAKEAQLATGRKRNCPASRRAALVISDIKLRTALICGYNRVVEVETTDRRAQAVDIQLPSNIEQAIGIFNAIA